jgi:exonuclease VII large subunit
MEDKSQCTNCKCYRIGSDFIGKSGNIVKRCLKCREKDAKQKKRPDIIEKRNKRQNEKKYYIKYREKKRAENEEDYLKHNAENMKKWCQNNKEHLAKWRTLNFSNRFYSIKQQAQKKGILWNEDLTDETCYKIQKVLIE